MKRPTPPQPVGYQRLSTESTGDTWEALSAAHRTLLEKIPDAAPSEMRVHCTDEGSTLYFERQYTNPKYKAELLEYESSLASYFERNPDITEEERQSVEKFMGVTLHAIIEVQYEGSENETWDEVGRWDFNKDYALSCAIPEDADEWPDNISLDDEEREIMEDEDCQCISFEQFAAMMGHVNKTDGGDCVRDAFHLAVSKLSEMAPVRILFYRL